MNLIQMYELVRKIVEEHADQYDYIGIRFEDKEREIGEELDWSRHNPDREDEREFPSFDSEEYEEMEVLDGTSAWEANPRAYREYHPGVDRLQFRTFGEKECSRFFLTDHCYIIAGDRSGDHPDPDDYEILIKDAVVIAKIF